MATPPRVIPSPSPDQHARPPAPFIPSSAGDIDQRFAQVADAINRKADRNAPVFYWIKLVASDGSTWALSVDAGGNLHTTSVLRS